MKKIGYGMGCLQSALVFYPLTGYVCSGISQDPYRSNPLCRGYCGLLAYLMWRREREREQVKEEELEGEKGERVEALDVSIVSLKD